LTCPSSLYSFTAHRALHSFPTRRSSDLVELAQQRRRRRLFAAPTHDLVQPQRRTLHAERMRVALRFVRVVGIGALHACAPRAMRSEEHTSELQSRENLVCRLLLEKKKNK